MSRTHFLSALATWALLFGASPGVVTSDGSVLVSVGALVPWALVCSRPGRRAFLAEWLAAACGFAGLMGWAAYVFAPGLLWIGFGQGVYMATAGVVLKRLAKQLPLALAVPLAWCCLETWRYLIPAPIGLGWWRLGHSLHAWPAIAGSARVWGVVGCSAVMACSAGALADAWRARQPARAALALVAPLVAALLALLIGAPETQPGPRLLLVQPAFPQERKSGLRADPRQNFLDLADWTLRGVEAAEAPPDLVCWGETMLYLDLYSPELREAFAEGLEVDEWWEGFGLALMDRYDLAERAWINGLLYGRERLGEAPEVVVLPEGTSFLAGHINYGLQDGRLRRFNAVSLWDAEARRSRAVGKTRLVPGAETLYGLEQYPSVRDFVRGVANYVPDLAAFERPESLGLSTRAGEHYRIGPSVCFDNAFIEPYTELLQREEVDFHLVVSNEAWYRRSFELDQMVAFSRMIALTSGRAIVRATNSGVSCVIGPDGRELDRLRVGGEDRMVAGTLELVVPVPADRAGGSGPEAAAGASRTPFLRLSWLWRGLAMGAAPLLLLARRRPRERVQDGYPSPAAG